MKNFLNQLDHFSILYILIIGFQACSLREQVVVDTSSNFYLYGNVDGKEIRIEYNKDSYKEDYKNELIPPPQFVYSKSTGYSIAIKLEEYKGIVFGTDYVNQAPAIGTYPVKIVTYQKSRFEEYSAMMSTQVNGVIVITKINDHEAEGTFSFTIEEDKSKGLAKVVVKDGRFRLKY